MIFYPQIPILLSLQSATFQEENLGNSPQYYRLHFD